MCPCVVMREDSIMYSSVTEHVWGLMCEKLVTLAIRGLLRRKCV